MSSQADGPAGGPSKCADRRGNGSSGVGSADAGEGSGRACFARRVSAVLAWPAHADVPGRRYGGHMVNPGHLALFGRYHGAGDMALVAHRRHRNQSPASIWTSMAATCADRPIPHRRFEQGSALHEPCGRHDALRRAGGARAGFVGPIGRGGQPDEPALRTSEPRGGGR